MSPCPSGANFQVGITKVPCGIFLAVVGDVDCSPERKGKDWGEVRRRATSQS